MPPFYADKECKWRAEAGIRRGDAGNLSRVKRPLVGPLRGKVAPIWEGDSLGFGENGDGFGPPRRAVSSDGRSLGQKGMSGGHLFW